MTGRPPVDELAYATPSSAERRAAVGVCVVLFAVTVAALPYGALRLGEPSALVPALAAGSFVTMLVSAVILRNQYRATRFVPYAYLGVAYGCTTALLAPNILTFPDVVEPAGLAAGSQLGPWLWVAYHITFLLLTGAYVWSESYFTRTALPGSATAGIVRSYAALCAGLPIAVAVLLPALGHRLPPLVAHGAYTPLFHSIVEVLLLGSCAVVLATLVARTSLAHTTDLWLAVVLLALGFEIYLGGEIVAAPFTLAWYASTVAGVTWQVLFLVAQLRHAHDQLAASAADKQHYVRELLRDPLTGLFNRRGFDERYGAAAADCRLARAPLILLALDLDEFKAYNDHFGHVAGDETLQAVGAALASVVSRPSDACCRIGGEEFAVVLPFTDLAGGIAVAERLRAAVTRLRLAHAPWAAHPTVTISVGLALADGATPLEERELHERADRALYDAKHAGRDRLALYDAAPPSLPVAP